MCWTVPNFNKFTVPRNNNMHGAATHRQFHTHARHLLCTDHDGALRDHGSTQTKCAPHGHLADVQARPGPYAKYLLGCELDSVTFRQIRAPGWLEAVPRGAGSC
eukprot:jgi/Ulvmu1/11071/UM007_0253.1